MWRQLLQPFICTIDLSRHCCSLSLTSYRHSSNSVCTKSWRLMACWSAASAVNMFQHSTIFARLLFVRPLSAKKTRCRQRGLEPEAAIGLVSVPSTIQPPIAGPSSLPTELQIPSVLFDGDLFNGPPNITITCSDWSGACLMGQWVGTACTLLAQSLAEPPLRSFSYHRSGQSDNSSKSMCAIKYRVRCGVLASSSSSSQYQQTTGCVSICGCWRHTAGCIGLGTAPAVCTVNHSKLVSIRPLTSKSK